MQDQLLLQPHRNRQLFSDYYLDRRLPERPEWQQLLPEAQAALQKITAIFKAYTPSKVEAQTEHDLIQPVLDVLGHVYEVQPALATPDGTKRPDYIFYRDLAARNANKNKTLDESLLQSSAYAVGDAKYWDRPLDMAQKSNSVDPFSNKNPGYQIAFYIQHTGLEWGILTNGRLWRLYHKDTAYKQDRFYEVDLPALVQTGSADQFRYFYAFFRRAAFEPQASDVNLSVAAILKAGTDFARDVGDTLKQQVYDALRHLAQGFLDYPGNRLANDPETLKQIYDNSLIVLYRLLFIFYAEARDLLPLRESTLYRDKYSLFAIARTVAREIDQGSPLLAETVTLWPRLKTLFDIIDRGNPQLRVTTYNGGLFDPARHPFLARYDIGDAHLQQAIDMLARIGGQFVDYRDLAVRHLGTIYEGLLEFRLQPCPPDDGWTVDLRTDKGERKATGSYYTPDYIVKYIVEQTVGPALEAAVANARDDEAKIAAVLGMNVLDPAMGSGHFLVEASDYIARYLANLVEGGQHDGESDLAYWKRRVAQSCIYGVDLNPLAVELAKLSLWLNTVAKDRPLSFLDHHLRCGNSLIGARLADLRVSRSAAKKPKKQQPKQTAETPEVQTSMLDDETFRRSMSTAVDSMWLIESSSAQTVADVKEQEQLYARLREELTRKYGRLADLVTATHFGVAVDPKLWKPLADYATGRPVATIPKFKEWVDEAEALAEQYRFFHWELEFPEVFFDRFGNSQGDQAGFDAVIGNPPWISFGLRNVGTLSSGEMEYYRTYYPNSAEYKLSTYTLFMERAITLLQRNGYQSFIVPDSFLLGQYFSNIRRLLTTKTHLLEVIQIMENFWQEANIGSSVIYVLVNQIPTSYSKVRIGIAQSLEDFEKGVILQDIVLQQSFANTPLQRIRLIPNRDIRSTVEKIERQAQQLSTIVKFYSGLIGKAGKDSIVISGKPLDYTPSKYAKLIQSGSLLKRYHLSYENFYIKLDKNLYKSGYDTEKYRNPKIFLNQTGDSLKPCYDNEGYFCLNNMHIGYLVSKNYNLLYVTAILAGKLMHFYYQVISQEKGRMLAQTDIETIDTLPIRRISFTTPDDERTKLVSAGIALYEAGKMDELLGFVAERLAAEPEQSDVVHDLLAHLAQQMIDLNQQRQQQVSDFVTDLEGYLSEKDMKQIGRLWTPPSAPKEGEKDYDRKQQEHAKASAEAQQQLGTLARQRIDLRDDTGAIDETQWKWLLKRRFNNQIPGLAALVRIFNTYHPPIATLDRRLAATDRLIDRIVYMLYGLTPAEIAIVEKG